MDGLWRGNLGQDNKCCKMTKLTIFIKVTSKRHTNIIFLVRKIYFDKKKKMKPFVNLICNFTLFLIFPDTL